MKQNGYLFYSLTSTKFLFLLNKQRKWHLPDNCNITNQKLIKILPLETYISNDNEFTYQTSLAIIQNDFIPNLDTSFGYAWINYNNWPYSLHSGLRNTLHNKVNKIKIETILNLSTELSSTMSN